MNKTGNGPPVARLSADPPSWNVGLGELLTLDASASFDPENAGPLTFAWTITPSAGVTVGQPSTDRRTGVFSVPGVYTVSLMLTDAASQTTTLNREVTVFSGNDFNSFSETTLGPSLTASQVEVRDNDSPAGWYSLEDRERRLTIQVLDDAAHSLNSGNHPYVYRDLPDTGDWVLQTDLDFETRKSGNFNAGLYVEVVEAGTPVRYAFGPENRNVLTVLRSANGAAFSSAAPAQSLVEFTALRVRRSGNQLTFSRRTNDVWVEVLTRALPAPTTAHRGGVFVATSIAQTVRISFDYLLVVDPTQTNSVLGNLRLTELMYNPVSGGVEFIELCNTGTQSISLQGVHFEDGSPFAAFTFGNVSLAAGEFIVLTENITAFQAKYGTGARIAGQWASGSLNNAGEAIILEDAQGNAIHDFQYDDIAPWPLTPDGQGPSLEVINVNGDYNDGLNWRASFDPEGTPGFASSGQDSDRDGIRTASRRSSARIRTMAAHAPSPPPRQTPAGTSPSRGRAFPGGCIASSAAATW